MSDDLMAEIVTLKAELKTAGMPIGPINEKAPSFRQLRVPIHMAKQISRWYQASGWKVEITEQD